MKDADSKTTRKSKPAKKKKGKPRVKNNSVDTKPTQNPQKPAPNLSKPAPKTTLNAKQTLFVLEYLVDLNATQAAIRAGYSERTAFRIGTENLHKPAIKSAIAAEIEKRKIRITFTADQVLEELARIGFADMSDFITIDSGGMIQANPLDTLAEGRSRIIKKVKEKRVIKSTAEGDQVLDATYEFELCDKVKSLELLSRHLGLLHDKQEVSGKGGGPVEHKVTVVYDDKAV